MIVSISKHSRLIQTVNRGKKMDNFFETLNDVYFKWSTPNSGNKVRE